MDDAAALLVPGGGVLADRVGIRLARQCACCGHEQALFCWHSPLSVRAAPAHALDIAFGCWYVATQRRAAATQRGFTRDISPERVPRAHRCLRTGCCRYRVCLYAARSAVSFLLTNRGSLYLAGAPGPAISPALSFSGSSSDNGRRIRTRRRPYRRGATRAALAACGHWRAAPVTCAVLPSCTSLPRLRTPPPPLPVGWRLRCCRYRTPRCAQNCPAFALAGLTTASAGGRTYGRAAELRRAFLRVPGDAHRYACCLDPSMRSWQTSRAPCLPPTLLPDIHILHFFCCTAARRCCASPRILSASYFAYHAGWVLPAGVHDEYLAYNSARRAAACAAAQGRSVMLPSERIHAPAPCLPAAPFYATWDWVRGYTITAPALPPRADLPQHSRTPRCTGACRALLPPFCAAIFSALLRLPCRHGLSVATAPPCRYMARY